MKINVRRKRQEVILPFTGGTAFVEPAEQVAAYRKKLCDRLHERSIQLLDGV